MASGVGWWDRAGEKEDGFFGWLATVPGTPQGKNQYDRLERLYKVNKQPGNYTYEDLQRALDRGTGTSWRDDPGGQDFVNDWLARRQGAVASAQAAAASNNSNPTPLDIDPKRGTGEYGDIIDSLRDELGTAQSTIQDLKDRQVETIETQQLDFQSALAQLSLGFEERYGAMQAMMQQQQQQYQQQMMMLQQQSQAAQAAYQQQLQIAQNLSRASVPEAEASAATAAIGDLREGESISRNTKDNALSKLSILSGLGTSSSPLAGLQLA